VQAGLRAWARSPSARPSTSAPRSRAAQICEVAEAFEQRARAGHGHASCGATLRNDAFKTDGKDYHVSADLDRPGQPPRRHPSRPTSSSRSCREQRRLQGAQHRRLSYGKTDKRIYTKLDHATTRST
jgi:class I fructose-bisphosphate aldolase